MTIQRLLELYEPVLVTDRVDVDANDEAWIALLRNGQRRFFALTTTDVLNALVPRGSLVAALVGRLAGQDGRQYGVDRRIRSKAGAPVKDATTTVGTWIAR